MYPKFIEVTCELGDEEHRTIDKKIINVDHIVAVSDNVIHCGKDGTFYADESYDELKSLITDCGCYINKGDPRLDMTHPLTMDDLKDMIGEPVWDSNNGRWYLIHWVDGDTLTAYLYSDEGVQVWRDDDTLKAKPLYRMNHDTRRTD